MFIDFILELKNDSFLLVLQMDSYSFRFFEETKFLKQFMLTILRVSFFLKFQPDIVVNCAALSIPRACEADPAAAMSINVPSSLIQWLSSLGEKKCLLIHLSTDQGKSC